MAFAMTEEQRALRDAVGDAVARMRPIAAVRAARGGTNRGAGTVAECWATLAGLGVFGAALPSDAGGAGGTAADAAVALERCAAALVPGPVLPTVLTGLALAARPATEAAARLLPGIADGSTPVAAALAPVPLDVRDGPGGQRVDGEVPAVLGASESPALLLLGAGDPAGEGRWFVLDAGHPGVSITGRTSADLSRSLATVTLHDVRVPAGRMLSGGGGATVRELAVTLAAAEAAGVAAWCVHTATEHAKAREQFGRPIGSFQAVKHLCVEMLCLAERAAVVAWDAARAVDEAPHELPLAASVAAAIALDAAVDTAKDAVQVLGGVGFTWDHDAHLYLRRALALRQLLGPVAGWRARVAELAAGGARRTLAVRLAPEVEQQRPAVRALVEEVASAPPQRRRARLADAGLLAPHWPAPYGQAASPGRQLLIDDELRLAGVQRPDLVIGGWAAPTLLAYGSRAQVERFVGPTLRGEITWCQLFSEPEAGSDLAALRTRADRVAGGWRLTGQKVWTSLASAADWAICLARTDPEAPKHKGITYFLVDMRAPGIEIRPLREITGDTVFNEVFLDGVPVPDEQVVGPVGGGWALARTTLANERVAMGGGSSLGDAVERLLAAAPRADERLGALVADGMVISLLELRATVRRLDGQDPGPESSVRKLLGVRHRQDVAEAALDVAGPDGAAADGPAEALVHEFLLTRCLSIAGGTTQILRTLAAERLLGLPR